MIGRIISINLSHKKGERKKIKPAQAECVIDRGLKGEDFFDAHATGGDRQISLLAQESIEKMRLLGLDVDSGDFAENITTVGVDFMSLPLGTIIRLGDLVLAELTMKGKTCHSRCAIYHQAGDCIMPREGVFVRVIDPGTIKVGDKVSVEVGEVPG